MQPIPFAPWVWRDPDLIAATVGLEPEPRGDRPEDDGRASTDLAGYDVEAIDGGIDKDTFGTNEYRDRVGGYYAGTYE